MNMHSEERKKSYQTVANEAHCHGYHYTVVHTLHSARLSLTQLLFVTFVLIPQKGLIQTFIKKTIGIVSKLSKYWHDLRDERF